MVIPRKICPLRFHRECTGKENRESNIVNKLVGTICDVQIFVSSLVHKLSCVLEWYSTSFRFKEQAVQV